MTNLTPDDVAAIRAELDNGLAYMEKGYALCDALEAAWAERDANWATVANAESLIANWDLREAALRERAERAEKRNDELRPWAALWAREGQIAVEALARVRALCNGDDPEFTGWIADTIRATLEGENS